MKRTVASVLLVVVSACGGGEPPADEDRDQAVPAALPVTADPAMVRSIEPSTGTPGTDVTLRAGGLPPGGQFEVGFGAANSNFEILGQARADSLGELSTVVRVPDWAEAGKGYQFVVAPVDQPPRATSDTFRVTAPTP